MGINTVGTPLAAKYNSIPYDVKADASITEMMRKYESEIVPSSGRGMHKKTAIVQGLSGMPFQVNQDERQQLDTDADSGPHIFEFKDAAGYSITGQAVLAGDSSRTSDEGTYTVDVQFDSKPTFVKPQ